MSSMDREGARSARALPLISRPAGSVSWARGVRTTFHELEYGVRSPPYHREHPEDEVLVEVRTHGADGVRVRLELPPPRRPVRIVELPGRRQALRDQMSLNLRKLRVEGRPLEDLPQPGEAREVEPKRARAGQREVL